MSIINKLICFRDIKDRNSFGNTEGRFAKKNFFVSRNILHKDFPIFNNDCGFLHIVAPVAQCQSSANDGALPGTVINDGNNGAQKDIIYNFWDALKNGFKAMRDNISMNKYRKTAHIEDEYDEDEIEKQEKELMLQKRREELMKSIVITQNDVQEYMAKETGRDRLRNMFTLRESGDFSNELQKPINMLVATVLITFYIGGMRQGSAARQKFLVTHQHAKWKSRIRAVRKMNDFMFFNALKGGFVTAVKYTTFIGMFLMPAELLSVYRNQSSPFHYSTGGAVAGCLYRINMGPKGMAAGLLIGSVLGMLGGSVFYGLEYLGHQRREDVYAEEIVERLTEKKFMQLQFLPYTKEQATEETIINNNNKEEEDIT